MFSNFKFIALLVGFCIVNIEADYINSEKAGQDSLLNFMIRTRDVSNEHPQRSMECFSYYVPILNEITAEYERSYAACLQKSSDAKSLVDNSTQADRKCIESSAEQACQLLSDCSTLKNSIDYFQCYVDGGSQNSKTMYAISANASDILVNIREQYRLIEFEENRCTNASERAYVEQTTATYEELHNCIVGLSPVPNSFGNSVPILPASANDLRLQRVVVDQAPNLHRKYSEQYNIAEGVHKFKRPNKLYKRRT